MWNGHEPDRVLCYMFLFALLDLTVHNLQQYSYHFDLTDQHKHGINLFSHNFGFWQEIRSRGARKMMTRKWCLDYLFLMPLLLNLLVSNSDIHPRKRKSRVTRCENSKSRFILLPITHRAANLGPITHHASLRTADAFPVVASLPPKNSHFWRERSEDRKCVCCSHASITLKTWSLKTHLPPSSKACYARYLQGSLMVFPF